MSRERGVSEERMEQLPIVKGMLGKFQGNLRDSEWMEKVNSNLLSDNRSKSNSNITTPMNISTSRRLYEDSMGQSFSSTLNKTDKGTLVLKQGAINHDL